MDRLQELWSRLATSPFVDQVLAFLPESVREPALGALLALVALGAGVLGWRLLFGAGSEARKVVAAGRKAVRRDLAQAEQDGDLKLVGEIHESLGNDRKALRAYTGGGHVEPRVHLLLRLGRRREAADVARAEGAWHLVAELASEEGAVADAALAWERAGKPFLAARAWEETGDSLQAARCYTATGLEADAVRVLGDAEGREAAEILDAAIRGSLDQARGSAMSLDMARATRHGVQLWLAEGEPERAWHLAVDAELLDLAAPIARDFLAPSAEAAELCERADAWLDAAAIWKKLGEERREALARAEHHERRSDAHEAARWLESAGEAARAADQWAAAGEHRRAADLYAEIGELESAAELYAQAGDDAKHLEMLFRLRAGRVSGPAELPLGALSLGAMPLGALSLGATVPSRHGAHPAPHLTESAVPTVGPPGAAESAAENAASPSSPDTRLPDVPEPDARYRLLEELGRGGMGIVYRADDRMLQREVAYKVVPDRLASDLVSPESLLAEARAAARLSHPNIVQVFDVGRRGDGFFVVMELVRGESLEARLKSRRLSVKGIVQVGRQIAAALDHAHARHLVHRDLKPSNLLWSEDDRRIKLTDFGLARISDDASGKVATRPAGTPSYMSPEQIQGVDLDPRADLYSFGCVLWEMATREPLFGGGIGSLGRHLNDPPQDPRALRDDLPDALAELILACLAKDPAARPESADEIGRALAELADELRSD